MRGGDFQCDLLETFQEGFQLTLNPLLIFRNLATLQLLNQSATKVSSKPTHRSPKERGTATVTATPVLPKALGSSLPAHARSAATSSDPEDPKKTCEH